MNLNLTVPQVKTLFFISNHGGTSPTRLAIALGVTPPNVTGIVDRLVEQDLMVRKDSPEDRRAFVLQITPKGEAILSGLRERRMDAMRRVLEQLDDEGLSQLVAGLSKLAGVALNYAAEDSIQDD